MKDTLRSYQEIERIIGVNWLNSPKNQQHPIFHIVDEWYLKYLNQYLKNIQKRKSTRAQLRNPQQFWDIYYELEVAYFLQKQGFNPVLHEKIGGTGTDVFLNQEKIVVEIKHLNIPYKVEKEIKRFIPKAKSHPIIKAVNTTYLNMIRMRSYFEDKPFQNIYPNIVCYCPNIMAGHCDDLKNLIEKEQSQIPQEVNALAIWKYPEIKCCIENPCEKKINWKSTKLEKFFNPS